MHNLVYNNLILCHCDRLFQFDAENHIAEFNRYIPQSNNLGHMNILRTLICPVLRIMTLSCSGATTLASDIILNTLLCSRVVLVS